MKKTITILALLLIFKGFFSISNCNAQTQCGWERSGVDPVSGSDVVYSVATDTSKNVYVVGALGGSTVTLGTITLTKITTTYKSDMVIAKYDKTGNVIWAYNFGGSYSANTIARSVAVSNNGYLYVTGYYNGTVNFASTTLVNTGGGSNDMFILKFDLNGNLIWAKSASSPSEALSVVCDLNGNFYVTGDFQGTMTLGSTTLINAGGTDGFLIKFDTNGNVLWANNIGGTGNEKCYSVGVDINGNVFLTGTFTNTSFTIGSTTLNTSGGEIFTAKYDSFGNAIWAKCSSGGAGIAVAYSIATDLTGNVYITGGYSNSITFGTNTITASSASFLVKYDNNGNVIWAKTSTILGNSTVGWAVATDTNGNVFITGDGSSGVSFLSKYDSQGNVIWTMDASLSTPISYEFAYSVATDSNGAVYVAGSDGFGYLFVRKLYFMNSTSSTTPVTCFGGSNGTASIVVTGGESPYSYQWTTGPFQTTPTAINLTQGIYTVTVTDGLGCTFTQTDTINQPPAITLGYTNTNVSCYNGNNGTATVNVTGYGTSPYTYAWSNGTSAQTATGLAHGTYTVTVTDAHSCTQTQVVQITQPPNLILSSSKTNSSCASVHDGIATASFTGGTPPVTYAWSNGPTTAIDNGLAAGSYTVTATDSKGCVKVSTIAVGTKDTTASFSFVVNNMTVTFTMVDPTHCTDSGFLWDFQNGSQNTVAVNPTWTYATPGTYTACLKCDNLPAGCVVCTNITVPGNYSGGTGVNEIDNNKGSVQILPNPNKGIFVLSFNNIQSPNSQFVIKDVLGRSLFSHNINYFEGNQSLDVSSYSNGIYYYQLINEKETIQGKFIIEK